MSKFYRVEFNTTGYYSGQGIFEVLDETNEIEAETAQEAIELAIEWLEELDPKCREYAWRAAEGIKTETGCLYLGEYENWKE